MVVELFMTDWIPRKVLATPELLDRLPAAIDAWVRFAARRAGPGLGCQRDPRIDREMGE